MVIGKKMKLSRGEILTELSKRITDREISQGAKLIEQDFSVQPEPMQF